jgi:hypothetical protein
MNTHMLVVSDPPHRDVDLEAMADVLGLDVFTARLKARFGAPEILGHGAADEAAALAAAAGRTGLEARVVPAAVLGAVPWPAPVSHLAFDEKSLHVTVAGRGVEVTYDTEALAVICAPPADYSVPRPLDLERALVSGHEPTIAEAMQEHGFIDLYLASPEAISRISIVPSMFRIDLEEVAGEIDRRWRALRMDARLAGVRPRSRTGHGPRGRSAPHPTEAVQRRGYSFGTPALADLLGRIAPELRDAPQFEIGSRLSCALHAQVAAA